MCPPAQRPRASARPHKCRARSSATTISTTPTPRSSLVGEFRDAAPTVVIVKHANPCGVATAGSLIEAYHERLRLRPRLGVRRDHRCQSAAGWPDGRGDHRHLHGSGRRTRCRRCGQGDFCEEEEPAPAAHRRIAQSGARRPRNEDHRRGDAGPVARQWRHCARRSQGGDPARADRAGTQGLPVRLDDRQACEVQRHRLREGQRHPRASARDR